MGKGILIGLLSALGSAVLVALVFGFVYFLRCTTRGRILLDRIGRPGEFDDEQAFLREEAEALERMDEISRQEYLRAKGELLDGVAVAIRTAANSVVAFCEANPPDSVATDISLSQYLAIQEKGVSAWEFEPELESADCFVQARTEIEFYDMECSVQSNLPIPKHNEVYYWEAKIFEKPESTLLGIGLTTKPYPTFRLPGELFLASIIDMLLTCFLGLHRHSVAYFSSGQKRQNQPFSANNYGPTFRQGDVIGVGYRPRTGHIFFTRNGKKLEDITHGFKSLNLFPTVGANGPCKVHVNLGQLGFVYIEANVKKWGLAPVTGSLAPPPPYGSEAGSILLEAGVQSASLNGPSGENDYFASGVPDYASILPHAQSHGHTRSSSQNTVRPNRNRANSRASHHTQNKSLAPPSTRPPAYPPTSPGPVRSPTDISLAPLDPSRLQPVDQRGPPPEYSSPTPSLRSRASFDEAMRGTEEDRPLLENAREVSGTSDHGEGRASR